MVIGAVLASGSGSRMKSDIPKQYLEICGKPIFVYSAEAFLKNEQTDCVIICVSRDWLLYAQEKLSEFINTEKKVFFVTGGETRGESLLNVLKFCDEQDMLDSIILTHDSVRPFITDEIIADSVEKCLRTGAAIACKPATDTMFITDEEGMLISSVPDRKTVFHAQTPQTFRTRELYETILSLPHEVFVKMTDAGSVYSYCGKPVAISSGSEDNLKITYPTDIPVAENTAKRLKLCQP